MITGLLPYLQTFLAIGNLCIMLWALKAFLTKPHTTLEERVKELEKRIITLEVKNGEIEKSLTISHDKHREQKNTNEMFITVVLAFIDFEIAFCQQTRYENTNDLIKAKKTLQEYLTKK